MRQDEDKFFRRAAGTTTLRLFGLELTYSLGQL
jgi:hypothetical protein